MSEEKVPELSPEDSKLIDGLIAQATAEAAKELLQEYRSEVLARAKRKVGEYLKALEELPS